MVHALRIVHNLLRDGGLLIDIHPVAVPRRVEVRIDGETVPVGATVDAARFATYRLADRALSQVVREGLFVPAGREVFTFTVHADTLPDLLAYFAEREWSATFERRPTVLEESIRQRITHLYREPGGRKEIVLHRPAGVTWFRRAGGPAR
jgi:hypothetical protein